MRRRRRRKRRTVEGERGREGGKGVIYVCGRIKKASQVCCCEGLRRQERRKKGGREGRRGRNAHHLCVCMSPQI
jgi:hypothetical protein